MSQRVRDRGPRRRCSSNRTLVRTIPGLQREVPPIPLLASTLRDFTLSQVADYEGIATGSWASMDDRFPGGTSSLAQNTAILYHHATIANRRTDSYEVTLPPVRLNPGASSSDGALYDFWFGTRGGISSLFRTPQSVIGVEVCPSPLPGDSHCEWVDGFTSIQLPQFYFGMSQSNATTDWPGIHALAPALPWIGSQISVRAVKFYLNGTATGSRIDNPQGNQRINLNKGDTFYCDIWLKFSRIATGSTNEPITSGRICLVVPLSNVFSGRRYYYNGSNSGAESQLIRFFNLNTTPNFDPIRQTYEITISGHSGWTLKDGSNGPHKMETSGVWIRDTPNPGQLRWRNGGQQISLFYGNEVPYVRLSFVGPFGVSGAYRPAFGASTSYRRTTTNLQVLNGNGSTNCAAATVIHVPSGVWDQAGTTTFDLCQPATTDFRGTLYGYRSGPRPAPVDEVPTSITLTRVPL